MIKWPTIFAAKTASHGAGLDFEHAENLAALEQAEATFKARAPFGAPNRNAIAIPASFGRPNHSWGNMGKLSNGDGGPKRKPTVTWEAQSRFPLDDEQGGGPGFCQRLKWRNDKSHFRNTR
jgi:hypothetical protein